MIPSWIAYTGPWAQAEPDVVQDLVPVVVGLLAVTAAYKIGTLRRGALPAQVALAGVFTALAVGVAPFAGVHTALLGDTPMVRGWGNVAARVFIVAAAGLAQTYLLLLARSLGDALLMARRRWVVAAVVGVTLVILGMVTPSEALGSAPMDAWSEVAIYVLFLGYLALALADVASASARWSRACRGAMRAGLSMIAIGALLGIVYATAKTAAVLVEVAGVEPSPSLLQAVKIPALAGLLLVSVGSVIPALSRGLGSVRHCYVLHRQLDELYPLWADIVALAPGIALEPVRPRWRDRLHLRELDVRLYRRVIEIRDGQLALRPGSSDGHVADSRGRPGDLHAALAQYAPGGERASMPVTMDDELTWWTEVAATYKRLARTQSETVRT